MSVRLDIRTVLAYWFWVTLIHWTNSKLRASNSPHSTTDLSYVCGPIISNHSPVCPPWYQHWTASEADEGGGSSCPLPCAPKVAILSSPEAQCHVSGIQVAKHITSKNFWELFYSVPIGSFWLKSSLASDQCADIVHYPVHFKPLQRSGRHSFH